MSQDLSDYVYLDAKERAFEIEIEARKEYETRKEEAYEKKLTKLDEEFRKKRETKESQRRIAHANLVNKSRTQKLIAKNKAILKLLNQTQLKLIEKIKNKTEYSKILQDIIVEGLIKLMEPKVYIRCLKKDVDIVKGVISNCERLYKEVIKKELNEDAQIELSVDEERCLEERVVPDFTSEKFEEFTAEHERQIKIDRSVDTQRCFGGVVLTNAARNIVCKNTLDVRVQQSFADCLPEIRQMLFHRDEPTK